MRMPNESLRRIAILAASGVEQRDIAEPLAAIAQSGLEACVIAPDGDTLVAWDRVRSDWGREFDLGATLDTADAADHDLLFLPGSVMNPDALRNDPRAIDLVCRFFETAKPVAALCRGPWMLINAGVARGEKHASYHSTRTNFRAFIEKVAGRMPLPGDDDDPRRRTARQEIIVWRSRGARAVVTRHRSVTSVPGTIRREGSRLICPV
ncbi:MAG: DJ-1/PfpI family protein [Acidobacteriota bacterium]